MFTCVTFFTVLLINSANSHMPLNLEPTLLAYKDYPWLKEPLRNLRRNFRNKFELKKKLNLLDTSNNRTGVYADNILHFEIEPGHPQYEKAQAYENDFANMLGMQGFKYVYKRDAYWRTWRDADDGGEGIKILNYRLESVVNSSCTKCFTMGYWVIEDTQPACTYEIFSLVDSDKVCIAEIEQFNKLANKCPAILKYSLIIQACDNPIVTNWRFSRMYNFTELGSNLLCEGQEKCEVTTIYQIQPQQIIFRIVNVRNKILYSRIMRSNQRNYACVEKCGVIDINTTKVAKNEDVPKVNLFLNKNKERHSHYDENVRDSESNEINSKNNRIHAINTSIVDAIKMLNVKPYVNWASRGFKFGNTVNQRRKLKAIESKKIRRHLKSVNVARPAIFKHPIARSGARRQFIEPIFKSRSETTTHKACCKDMEDIGDQSENDDSDLDYNTYYDFKHKEY